MNKTKRWKHVDESAQRLLGELGLSDVEYYSAEGERRVHEALRAWPLLAAVVRALDDGGAVSRSGRGRRRVEEMGDPGPSIAVLVPEARPTSADAPDEMEDADDPDDTPKEAG